MVVLGRLRTTQKNCDAIGGASLVFTVILQAATREANKCTILHFQVENQASTLHFSNRGHSRYKT